MPLGANWALIDVCRPLCFPHESTLCIHNHHLSMAQRPPGCTLGTAEGSWAALVAAHPAPRRLTHATAPAAAVAAARRLVDRRMAGDVTAGACDELARPAGQGRAGGSGGTAARPAARGGRGCCRQGTMPLGANWALIDVCRPLCFPHESTLCIHNHHLSLAQRPPGCTLGTAEGSWTALVAAHPAPRRLDPRHRARSCLAAARCLVELGMAGDVTCAACDELARPTGQGRAGGSGGAAARRGAGRRAGEGGAVARGPCRSVRIGH